MNRRRRFMFMLRKVIRKHRPQTFSSSEVRPKPGCILKCDLGILLEHTGVYIGNGHIVSLNRHGNIRIESSLTFFPPGTNPKSNRIYTACYGNSKEVLCGKHVAKRAKSKVDDKTRYNVLFNNCHRFTTGCISGNFDNDVMSFSQLEEIILMYIEELRPPQSLWKRIKKVFSKKTELVKPSTFNWRAVTFKKP